MNAVVLLILFLVLKLSLEFHQTDYSVIFERYNIVFINKSYVANISIIKKFVTRYDIKYTVSGCLVQDIDAHNVELHVEGRKFQSNEYRLFPFNYTENTCVGIRFSKFGDQFKALDTNFKPTCDVKKGCYYFRNIYMEDSAFPPFAPRGRFKLTMLMIYHKKILIGHVEYFIEIKPRNPLERTIGV